MIVILTNSLDGHSDAVQARLNAVGFPCIRFDLDLVDSYEALSVILRGNPLARDMNGRPNDIEPFVTTVWIRRPGARKSNSVCDKESMQYSENSATCLMRDLYALTPHATWINDYYREREMRSKPCQLSVAHKCGLMVPEWIITTSHVQASEFTQRYSRVVTKTLSTYSRTLDSGKLAGSYANIITTKQILRKQEEFKVAPVLLQRYIEKKAECRVTVIGQQLFSLLIKPKKTSLPKTQCIDWRSQVDNYIFEECVLPSDVERGIKLLMKHAGLAIACMDFVVTDRNEYFFLELNPNGQWLWVEEVSKMPLVEAFAGLLSGYCSP